MGVSSGETHAHGDEDHGHRDVDAALVVSHEAPPAGHASEGVAHHPSTGQNLEALRSVPAADDLDDEAR